MRLTDSSAPVYSWSKLINKTRVVLDDDQTLLRERLRRLVDSAVDPEVAREAGTGADAVGRVREQRADVVVMDIRMPGMDGIEATRQITSDESLAGGPKWLDKVLPAIDTEGHALAHDEPEPQPQLAQV